MPYILLQTSWSEVSGQQGEVQRTIGLLGGMGWESSVEYERIINQEARRRLGGSHSARLIVISYDFADIEALQSKGRWTDAADLLAEGAVRLERAGAEVIVLCTNTMHRVADAVERAVSATFVHIADATAAAIQRAGLSTVGLLGTRYTMEGDFLRNRLEQGRSRQAFVEIIGRLEAAGAQGVVAGCTEIELLVTEDDIAPMEWFPTTRLHALAAVDAALAP